MMRGTAKIEIRSINGTQKMSLCTGWASQSQREDWRRTKQKRSSSSRPSPTTVWGRPDLVLFGEGDWTCSIANFTGTMTGPMAGPDGKTIQPANKKFQVEFCTVAHWNEKGEIVEERLFYDLVGLMRQLGLM